MVACSQIRAMMDVEWNQLCAQMAAQLVPQDWVDHLPIHALPAGLMEVDAICDLVWHRDDKVAAGLVRLSQGGDKLAGRVFIQAMLPKLWTISRRDINHGLSDYISVAWLRLMSFPVETRPNAVLVNISLDCLKVLSRQKAVSKPEVVSALLSQPNGDALIDGTATGVALWRNDNSSVASEQYVRDILALADRDKLLSPTCVDVLRSVYCDGLSGREAAARHQISHDMVRYYCSSAVKVLRARRWQLIDELGDC